ncbi:NAD(P)-binding protein [Xylaria telfairii]|nr:NAD(P)-binding protein [Xylaria telfairii]
MATILITGSNRGIGFAIAQAVCDSFPKSTVLLGCRDVDLGEDALNRLRLHGVTASLHTLSIDIESDVSIAAAVTIVREKFGKVDILINNAIKLDSSSPTQIEARRRTLNSNFNNAVTSNDIVTHAFVPLLRRAPWPRVIMVSSTRGSIQKTANRELPPVASIDYCVAKAALNMLTVHLQAAEDAATEDNKITFWVTNPGHCKTGFNGFKGHKDPLDGAEVVLRLLRSERGDIEGGTFWEFENDEFRQVPW